LSDLCFKVNDFYENIFGRFDQDEDEWVIDNKSSHYLSDNVKKAKPFK